jgi:6-phosphogluconate dehydrogenase
MAETFDHQFLYNQKSMKKSDIGVFGLGVMGRNLALNLEESGFRVSVYNRMEGGEKRILDEFIDEEAEGNDLIGCRNVEDFVESIKPPRSILLMVSAGKAVDAVIDQLKPHLETDDMIIDGGNSHFDDTRRRVEKLSAAGVHLVGMGVSGGEEGARFGPSLMPGGSEQAWRSIKPVMEAIAAKAEDGSPCCRWMGGDGAGHFVKMVHNGIEYGDMQIIAEASHLMRSVIEMTADEISQVFREWNSGKLNGYLTEITADIFSARDEDGEPLVEKILDAAGQKGTGRWTVIAALELGVPLPVITSAVYSRSFSAFKDLRVRISGMESGKSSAKTRERKSTLDELEQAMIAARLMNLAEGFFLIHSASEQYGWEIDPVSVAKTWRGGCIIRSALLEDVITTFEKHPDVVHLLQSPEYFGEIESFVGGLVSAVALAGRTDVPVPALSSALNQLYTLRSGELPANVIQAQRDYFGAHTYERTDRPRGDFFHTDWNE